MLRTSAPLIGAIGFSITCQSAAVLVDRDLKIGWVAWRALGLAAMLLSSGDVRFDGDVGAVLDGL